jgi:glycosyltransferase involved in cell wall biosynthesis
MARRLNHRSAIKVLHVFGRMERGGAELRTLELVESLSRAEFDSDFLVLSDLPGSLDSRVKAAGGQVIPCPLTLAFPFRAVWLLITSEYDVVHSHVHHFSGLLLFLAWIARVPGRIAHLRSSTDGYAEATVRRRVQRLVLRWLTDAFATDILSVSEGVMTDAWDAGWSRDNRCRVVYNGLPVARLTRVSEITPRSHTLICVGSVHQAKNQVRLVAIFQVCKTRMPELELEIVGRHLGAYAGEVVTEMVARGLGDSIKLTGEVPEPLEVMAAASVLILPSLWEGLPGVVLEAAALGLPVVASDLPGVKEIAKHFPHVRSMSLSQSDDEWADAIVDCLTKRSLVSRSDASALLATSPFNFITVRDVSQEVWRNAASSTR